MIPRFRLERPRNMEEALAAFEAGGGDAAYLAGGTELLQVMKMGLAEYTTLIDLKAIDQLKGIGTESDGTLRIGAAATHREIERSSDVAGFLPALVELEHGLANQRVRNTGTLGGNLAFAEPHSDPATLLLACGARVELLGRTGSREVGMADFTLGPLFTAREPDEVVVAVRVPHSGANVGVAYSKAKFFERPAVSVAVRVSVANGAIERADVALGALTEVPMLMPQLGEAITDSPAEHQAVDAALGRASELLDTLDVVEDHNGSVDYKRHLASVLLRRTAASALDRAMAHA